MHASAHLVRKDDTGNSFRVPEQLIHVIVTNDLVVIPFPPYKFPLHHLVALIPDESVERLDDRPQVEALRYWLHPVLALRRAVVVVGALEDEAQALGHESHLCRFAPTEQVERDLA